MTKGLLRTVALLLIACSALFSNDHLLQVQSVTQTDDGMYFMGTIENNGIMTGVFGRRRDGVNNKSWCVFIGANGQVYKMAFIDRDISYLYIDGKKVDDSLIWKHTAEFRVFYDKYWRERDIEAASAALESEMKPLNREIESVAKQMQKIDQAQERVARQGGSTAENKSLDNDRGRLSQIERNLDREIEGFAKRQESLAKEQESLRLMDETDKVLDQILQDLKALGAIKQKTNTTFKLSTAEFVINGKTASPEIYELMKNRYLPDSVAETGFMYHWKER